MKRRILCFGDSNTFGFDPKGARYDEDTRWPCRLETLMGSGTAVVEEGFNGRTCVFDDPTEGGYKSALTYLPPCLMSHTPLDAVVLMLGSNDAKKRFGLSAVTIGQGIMQLIRVIRLYGMDAQGKPPKILLVAPVPIGEGIEHSRYWDCFGPDAVRITRELTEELRRVARLTRCDYLNAADFAEVSPQDSLHLTAKGHIALAGGIAAKLKEMLGDTEAHT